MRQPYDRDHTVVDNSASEVPASDTGKFRVVRAGSTTSALTFFYAVSGTAKNGLDYKTLTGRAKIRAGATNAVIQIRAIDDSIPSGRDSHTLPLTRSTYTIGSPNGGTVTIHSNE